MVAKGTDIPGEKDLINQIADDLRRLPTDKVHVIRDIVAVFLSRPDIELCWDNDVTDEDVLRAVRPVLDECWNNPDEDAAWAHL